jgi:hypothetical protein
LESNGWKIKMDRVIKGRIDLVYVECAWVLQLKTVKNTSK